MADHFRVSIEGEQVERVLGELLIEEGRERRAAGQPVKGRLNDLQRFQIQIERLFPKP